MTGILGKTSARLKPALALILSTLIRQKAIEFKCVTGRHTYWTEHDADHCEPCDIERAARVRASFKRISDNMLREAGVIPDGIDHMGNEIHLRVSVETEMRK